jgi:hypothetical protein
VKSAAAYGSGLPAERVVCPDSLGHALLDNAARALRGHGGTGLGHVPVLGRHGHKAGPARRQQLVADARAQAVPIGDVDRIDTEAVARWIVGHYPEPIFPGVVLGSPHGSAVHLAAALGAPWLPAGFTVTVPWPRGSAGDWVGAMEWGAGLAERIIANNPDVGVRQVHDPVLRGPLCAATVTLQVQWRRPPAAYRDFLRSRLAPHGTCVLFRDTRTWPVLERTPEYSFQIGTPAGGLDHSRYTMDDPSFRGLIQAMGDDRWASPDQHTPLRYGDAFG